MNHMILTVNSDYFLKYFNLFVFLMHKHFASCEVRTEMFIFHTETSLGFNGLNRATV
jgi:hypothetical protein